MGVLAPVGKAFYPCLVGQNPRSMKLVRLRVSSFENERKVVGAATSVTKDTLDEPVVFKVVKRPCLFERHHHFLVLGIYEYAVMSEHDNSNRIYESIQQ